jgi:hypothetical protein
MSQFVPEGANMMQHSNLSKRGYMLAAFAGAVGGGIAVALTTKAIPRLVSQLMNEMMSKMPRLMMEHMKSEGFDPAEMCTRMKKMFAELDEHQTAEGTPSV